MPHPRTASADRASAQGPIANDRAARPVGGAGLSLFQESERDRSRKRRERVARAPGASRRACPAPAPFTLKKAPIA